MCRDSRNWSKKRFTMATAPLLILVILGFMTQISWCSEDIGERNRAILEQLLGAGNYDPTIRPQGDNSTETATVVHINMYLRSFKEVDERKGQYSIQVTFRERWFDNRLKFNDNGGKIKYVSLIDQNRIWVPDLFFSNENKGAFHDLMVRNTFIRIFPGGTVLYSTRLSLTLSCNLDFKVYPLDKQLCSIRMASYGWTTDDLKFFWKIGDSVTGQPNPPGFTLENYKTDYCNSKTGTGEYSCLMLNLFLKRHFSHYLYHYYIPCCLLVMFSWISFWLHQTAIPARLSVCLVSLLAISQLTSGMSASLPPLDYLNALDFWSGVCLLFAFGALLEFAIVNHLSSSDNVKRRSKEEHVGTASDTQEKQSLCCTPEVWEKYEKRTQICCQTCLSSSAIDVFSRLVFPALFLLFNLIYWPSCLIAADVESD